MAWFSSEGGGVNFDPSTWDLLYATPSYTGNTDNTDTMNIDLSQYKLVYIDVILNNASYSGMLAPIIEGQIMCSAVPEPGICIIGQPAFSNKKLTSIFTRVKGGQSGWTHACKIYGIK